jgi:hypothetical protein
MANTTGQPGAGCDDPRHMHNHWCGFCGAVLVFTRAQCQQLRVVPPCSRCGEQQWRNEVNEIIAPDYREQ